MVHDRASTVIGHHGTISAKAATILEDGFIGSDNPTDWLGRGIYFFEGGPGLAAHWADRSCDGEETCVIEAEIELRDCLDLTNTEGRERLLPFYDAFLDLHGREKVKAMNQRGKYRPFDCGVINLACDTLAEDGEIVRVIRAVFFEGEPLWVDPTGELAPATFGAEDHIQLAVRDPSLISNCRILGREAIGESA